MIFLFFYWFVSIFKTYSQNHDITNFLRFDDYIYDKTIHTPLIFKKGNELTYPIISLNPLDTLQICFDSFDTIPRYFKYTIFHCDFLWNQTNVDYYEYAQGLKFAYIDRYFFSNNTYQKYIHYEFFIPNEYITITKSGNYLLVVFNEKDSPVLSLKFYVYERLVNIEADVMKARTSSLTKTHQELIIRLKTLFSCQNPLLELKTCVTQNFRPDMVRCLEKPLIIDVNYFLYDNEPKLFFPSSNEFRWFDTKNESFYNMKTNKIELKNDRYYFTLTEDTKKKKSFYLEVSDINGFFLINRHLALNPHTEADYVYVKISAKIDTVVKNGNFYVCGYFNKWKTNSENILKYNPENKLHEVELYLKQGYYNYQIFLLKDYEKELDSDYFEGNFSDTENDYYVFVYWKSITANIWRLVGVARFNSHKK